MKFYCSTCGIEKTEADRGTPVHQACGGGIWVRRVEVKAEVDVPPQPMPSRPMAPDEEEDSFSI